MLNSLSMFASEAYMPNIFTMTHCRSIQTDVLMWLPGCVCSLVLEWQLCNIGCLMEPLIPRFYQEACVEDFFT